MPLIRAGFGAGRGRAEKGRAGGALVTVPQHMLCFSTHVFAPVNVIEFFFCLFLSGKCVTFRDAEEETAPSGGYVLDYILSLSPPLWPVHSSAPGLPCPQSFLLVYEKTEFYCV